MNVINPLVLTILLGGRVHLFYKYTSLYQVHFP